MSRLCTECNQGKHESDIPAIIWENIRFLDQGIGVLEKVSDSVYVCLKAPFLQGGMGRHVRHVLDHFILFGDGVGDGVIDFDDRNRDERIEKDRLFAIRLFREIRDQLVDFAKIEGDLEAHIKVRHNGVWCQSSIGRELQHLLNHTVHHYAIIAIILRLQDEPVAEDFGVAPSTLQAQVSE